MQGKARVHIKRQGARTCKNSPYVDTRHLESRRYLPACDFRDVGHYQSLVFARSRVFPLTAMRGTWDLLRVSEGATWHAPMSEMMMAFEVTRCSAGNDGGLVQTRGS
jgi:hypothetical protein